VFLGSDIDGTEVEEIGVWIVAIDLKDFGDEPAAGPAFDVDDSVEGISDIRFDRTVGEFHPALQDTAGKASESLLRGTCMDRTQRTGVACVQELEQVERLAPSNFSELRGEFICSWCEMRDGYLSAVPHPKSKCQVRRFAYPREADIVGRVIGVTMRLVEAEP
jgi:hypothetical protein